MAQLTRKTLIQFGNAGPTSSFGQFGSKTAGLPQTSQDPTVIQQLAAWVDGWQDAVVNSDKAAYLEDMNGWCFVHSYMVAYIYQMGVPEWDSGTAYYLNSVVQDNAGNGQWFKSLQNNNLGNTPPPGASNAFWRWVNPPEYLVGASVTLNALPKVTGVSPANGVPGAKTLGDSQVSEDGANVVIGLPLKFADNSVQTTAATSVVTSRFVYNPGGARALNTVYTNSGSKPLFATVSVYCHPNTVTMQVLIGVGTPTTVVAQAGSPGGTITTEDAVSFWVLPGESYKVNSAGDLLVWTEWA